MKILHIDVRDKIATYRSRDGEIVCGNTDYKIQFSLDAEWSGLDKTARFIWNGKYFDVPLREDDSCVVPVISKASVVKVGLYAEKMQTTTSATINCKRSILCGGEAPNPGYGENYTTEAKEAAESAKNSAENAKASAAEAAEVVGSLEPRVTTNEQDIEEAKSRIDDNIYRIQALGKHIGVDTMSYKTIEVKNDSKILVPENSLRYAQIIKIEGNIVEYTQYGGAVEGVLANYLDKIVANDGSVVVDFDAKNQNSFFSLMALNLGWGLPGNYLYLNNDDGKFYYHRARKLVNYDYVLKEGESVYSSYGIDGEIHTMIVNYANPSDLHDSNYDRYLAPFSVSDMRTLTFVPKYTESDIPEMVDMISSLNYRTGNTTIAFEIR